MCLVSNGHIPGPASTSTLLITDTGTPDLSPHLGTQVNSNLESMSSLVGAYISLFDKSLVASFCSERLILW